MPEANFQTVVLRPGRHRTPSHGVCVMELASMLAGERFTDRPGSACPALTAFLWGYNDAIDYERRQDLRRLAVAVLGTRAERGGAERLVERRAEVLAGWARTVHRRRRLRTPWGPRLDHRGGTPQSVCMAAGAYCARRARSDDRVHAETLELVERLAALARPPERAPAAAPSSALAPPASVPAVQR